MKKKVYGSFTIEALLIMPLVLFTILSIMYLSFYLYDFCKIQGLTDLVLHKAILNLKHEADIETGEVFYQVIGNQGVFYQLSGISHSKKQDIESILSKKLSKGLLATRITDIEVSANLFQLVIRIKGEFQIPIKGLAQIISIDRSFKVEAKAALHNPADAVRISEIILDMGSRIKGLSELKEKISMILP